MLKIRLRRMGARNRPFYRVVVSDSGHATPVDQIERFNQLAMDFLDEVEGAAQS